MQLTLGKQNKGVALNPMLLSRVESNAWSYPRSWCGIPSWLLTVKKSISRNLVTLIIIDHFPLSSLPISTALVSGTLLELSYVWTWVTLCVTQDDIYPFGET
jgi:hypothetical protein